MKKQLLLIALMSISLFAISQETSTKEVFKSKVTNTDRGSYSKAGSNIKKGLQVELGLDYEWTDSKNTVFKTDVFSPIEAKLRLGLSKYVELDFAISNRQLVYRPWDEDGAFSLDKYNYWTPFEIGIRTQFVDSKKKCDADASFYLGLGINTTQRSAFEDNGDLRPWVLANRPSYVTPEMGLYVDHNLGKRLELTYNFGLKWTGIALDDAATSKNPDIFYTLRLLAHVAQPLDIYIEHFNFMRSTYYSSLGLNAGLRFAATKKLVLDVNGGIGLNEVSPEGFAGLGLTYKLGK